MKRERLGSRLGFIFLSAGCAIGCGNVWKFPWMAGQYGGGGFVLIYALCLLLLGLPVMVMELSLGRASQASPVRMYQKLEKKGQLGIWFMGLLCSAVIVVHIFFADELFRFRLSFRVADPYDLEPSDWEIFGRYASWTITTVMILVIYIMGLQ